MSASTASQLLRHRPFALYFSGRLFSHFSRQIIAVAVGWQVYEITGSAFHLGMVGLAQFDTLGGSLLPVALFLGINMIEAQFVTPAVIGHTQTLNPFVVLLAVIFGIWLWGAAGGFIAIPVLLIASVVVRHIVPGMGLEIGETGSRRR